MTDLIVLLYIVKKSLLHPIKHAVIVNVLRRHDLLEHVAQQVVVWPLLKGQLLDVVHQQLVLHWQAAAEVLALGGHLDLADFLVPLALVAGVHALPGEAALAEVDQHLEL